MERVSWTGNVSLRYGVSQRSVENEASSSAMATVKSSDSDVDFDDVFGGPPTRTRYSFGGGRIKSSEESTSSPVGLSERPVFGESYSSPRRRTSDDFYDDIFRKSDESVRSPRWSSTTPGSRTLSPANPKIEPIAGSVPTEFSLPAKMTKFVDIPVFGSNSHTPNTSLSRFSSPSSQGRNVFRDNQGKSPGQIMLSRESSGVKESLYPTRTTEKDIGHNSKDRTGKAGSPSSEFHFSIHKWANVGVPLLMSLRGGKYPTLKGNSKVSALSMDNMQDTGFPNDDLSIEMADAKPLLGIGKTEVIEKEISSMKKVVEDQEVIPPSSLLHDEVERQGYVGREVEGIENTEAISGVPNSEVGSTRKKKAESKKMNSNKKSEVNKPAVISPKSSPKSRVKGMVKDFFKMSNQESPPKPKTNVVSGNLSSRWKTTVIDRTQEELIDTLLNSDTTVPDTSNKTKPDNKVPAENAKMAPDASDKTKSNSQMRSENVKMNPDASNKAKLDSKVPAENMNTKADASSKVKEDVGRSSKPKFPQNRTIKKLEDIYFQKDDASPASESVPSGSKITVENIDDPSLDTFQVEELAPDDSKLSKTQEDSETIKALDSKIHMWSSGRKGNIRSLLSTLQLVLWADSGWKPVKLVDIIEANAVKKSYNRAMLCLHPDKLQQKGVDSQKKYVAEKVFDILQEAWDHFNTLGTLV